MTLGATEFEALITDTSKRIDGDIAWSEDQDHSPAVEFRIEVASATGWPLFVNGSWNRLAGKLTYAMILQTVGRIYALDMGADHHNPSCTYTGEVHKHRWTELFRDKDAYVPEDITAPVAEPVEVWRQFCREAAIVHTGTLSPPPPAQEEFPV
ncbi:MAG: hypothetical protein WD208_03500 [Dehalococcoidia bacterium]